MIRAAGGCLLRRQTIGLDSLRVVKAERLALTVRDDFLPEGVLINDDPNEGRFNKIKRNEGWMEGYKVW